MSEQSPEPATLTVDGRLFDAARTGDAGALDVLLREHPDRLHARAKPYEWSLLHLAAANGHLAAVDLLLRRGLPVNTREKGDDTYAMHWAAAHGYLEVLRRLADAGGDVVGHGDDHGLEVIGWATCWEQCHGAVAEFLVGRGAWHHIFSAIAMGLADEVRRIVAADPEALSRPMSRNEDFRRPLHFAVLKNRPEMVDLLLELGADPLATDGSGFPAVAYATGPGVDRGILERIRSRGKPELFTALALEDWETAARLLREDPNAIGRGGALHLMAKRNGVAAVTWLLDHGADPNALWPHWDADVSPLHLAAAQGHAEVVRLLLAAGADPTLRDSKHDGDTLGWAHHFGRQDVVRILEGHKTTRGSALEDLGEG